MTFFGKFFVLLNTVVAFALLSWGFSIYANRIDWTEVQDGDKKLTERTRELNDAMSPAQRDHARQMNATATAESEYEKLREVIQKRTAESETGIFYDLNKTGQLINDSPKEEDKINGIDGKPLLGVTILQQDLVSEVDRVAAASKKFDQYRKDQAGYSGEITNYDIKSARLKRLLKDLRDEEIFIADSRINWDEQLVTLQKRNKQLQDKLAEVARLQKDLKTLRPTDADTARRPISK